MEQIFHKGYKFRLYPTKEQEQVLLNWERALKTLWNIALEQRLMAYSRSKDERKYPSFYEQREGLQELRKEYHWLNELPFVICDEVLQELDKAWQRCFSNLAKAPYWKRKIDYVGMKVSTGRSFCIEFNGNPIHEEVKAINKKTGAEQKGVSYFHDNKEVNPNRNYKLHFPKMKEPISIIVHRPMEGIQKNCTIKRSGNKWYASIMCEIEKKIPENFNSTSIGIDVGVANAISDSNGKLIPNPQFDKLLENKKKRFQRKLAKKEKGSKNKIKVLKALGKITTKIANQRNNFQHQQSNYYAKNYSKVFVEDLNIKNMTKNNSGTIEEPGKNVAQKSGLNRGILNVGWYSFVYKLNYKLGWNGGQLIKVQSKYTSQTCPKCKNVDKDNRKTQEDFKCIVCGYINHADIVGAINILNGIIIEKKKPKTSLKSIKK